ncbi:MAG: hypothetical protein FWD53_09785, partial [Phycisphaerales bacterium]|nr:hypothetical protein [Phycisphaerales bacterium]
MMLRFLTVVILAGSVLTGCGGTWRSETRTETEINPEHVKGSDTPRTPMSIKETPSMVYTLPPPEKKAPKSRDFNELIPRLMNPVNTNKDPVQAAANLF